MKFAATIAAFCIATAIAAPAPAANCGDNCVKGLSKRDHYYPPGGEEPPTGPPGEEYPPTHPPTNPPGGEYPPTEPPVIGYPPVEPPTGEYPPGGEEPPTNPPYGGEYPTEPPTSPPTPTHPHDEYPVPTEYPPTETGPTMPPTMTTPTVPPTETPPTPGGGNPSPDLCPKGLLYGSPQCCDTDILGIANLNCDNRKSSRLNLT